MSSEHPTNLQDILTTDPSDSLCEEEPTSDTGHVSQKKTNYSRTSGTTDTDYYKILGAPRDALQAELQNKFQQKLDALKSHPNFVSQVKLVTTAYTVLCDEDKRKAYDKELQEQNYTGLYVIEAWIKETRSKSNERAVKLFATIVPECVSNMQRAATTFEHDPSAFHAAIDTITNLRSTVEFTRVHAYRRVQITEWKSSYGFGSCLSADPFERQERLFVHLKEFEEKVEHGHVNSIGNGTIIEFTHADYTRKVGGGKRPRGEESRATTLRTAMNAKVATDDASHWHSDGYTFNAFVLSQLLGQVGGVIHTGANGTTDTAVRAGSFIPVDLQNNSRCPINVDDKFVFVCIPITQYVAIR